MSTHDKKLRRVRCCCFTLEDVYVILCLVVSLLGLAATALEAFNAFEVPLWRRIYVSSLVGAASVLCFLQAVPTLRVQSFNPHLLTLFAILSFGSAGGFGFSYEWASGVNVKAYIVDKMRHKLSAFGDSISQLEVLKTADYVDAIIFCAAAGVATTILAAIHEFFLKPDEYPRKRPFRYLMYLVAVALISGLCLAIGLLTINPDLPPISKLFGKEFDLATFYTQPQIAMSALRFAGAAAVGLLVFRRWQLTVFSKILVVVVALSHVCMAVIAFVDFNLGKQWQDFPNKFVGISFSVTGILIFMTISFAKSCAPPKEHRAPTVTQSDLEWDAEMSGNRNVHVAAPQLVVTV